MEEKFSEEKTFIHSGMTLLDVVSKFRGSEEVFKKFDEQAGVCLCCEALFDSLETVASKYRLDLEGLMTAIKIFVSKPSAS